MKKISSKTEFDAELSAGDRAALFYSPWCPFCSMFMPAFEKEAGRDPRFIAVSVDDVPELEDKFSVDVVPTVIIFSGGRTAARLDGALGRGLNAAQLAEFVARRLPRK
ncbi:MAG: thioredoxin family protein [Elusimicrobia bacterium]|nr:thioredoxin family protein [Elusimicrobiota bacterium]